MSTTTLSSRGQIVIPKSIRESHAWEAGQEFEVIETESGVELRPQRVFPRTTVEEAAGSIKYDGPPVPIEHLSGSYAAHLKYERGERW